MRTRYTKVTKKQWKASTKKIDNTFLTWIHTKSNAKPQIRGDQNGFAADKCSQKQKNMRKYTKITQKYIDSST